MRRRSFNYVLRRSPPSVSCRKGGGEIASTAWFVTTFVPEFVSDLLLTRGLET